MNAAHNEPTTSSTAAKTCGSLLATLGDVGAAWAAYGLRVGKLALETSADTLGKTAKALDLLAVELAKKAAAEKAADAGVEASAAAETTAAAEPVVAPSADAPSA